MLQIYSYQNPFKPGEDKDQYCFRSVVDETVDGERLVREIAQYNSTITEADARAVLAVLDDRVRHFVRLGYKVELPFGTVFNRANGTVAGLHKGFVPGSGNHRITSVFKFTEDAAEEMTQGAEYRLAGRGFVRVPVVRELRAVLPDGTESGSLVFKPGALLRLRGRHVSFDANDAAQGVFVRAQGGERLRIGRYSRIGSNVVEGFIPDGLAAGSYEVTLVTKPGLRRYEQGVCSARITVE